ncbi:MAG TPA: PLD nuclease N-terminal domain-containing protein [Symbiobacteriaceae bacterium]|nr:PLD nuclease N-terminal domain-containing protein [Symbiobacteriaceae bacterium]
MSDVQSMLPVIAPILVIQLILVIVALVDLVRREPDQVRGPKWVWALVCIFGSLVGSIVYFVVGRKN